MENLSIDRLVLETDAPYLAPVPCRGKRNEPSFIRYVLEKLAVIKGMEKDEVAEATTRNARDLFALRTLEL